MESDKTYQFGLQLVNKLKVVNDADLSRKQQIFGKNDSDKKKVIRFKKITIAYN